MEANLSLWFAAKELLIIFCFKNDNFFQKLALRVAETVDAEETHFIKKKPSAMVCV